MSHRLLLVVCLAVACVLGVVLIVTLVPEEDVLPGFTFDEWRKAKPEQRDRFMAAIAESGVLVGKTEEEVYALLGEPDGASYGGAVYRLRDESKQCSPALVFRFTRDGRVRSRRLSCMGGTISYGEFNEERWRSGGREDRLAMVRDLVATVALEGMSREELYRLLGSPDQEYDPGPHIQYCQRYYGKDGTIRKGIPGASKCLWLTFSDGRVSHVRYAGS